ncbi:hypothetical protein [endosymbiont GvMRE of Glomus versiforme]|uniref:hypothetical protein n=1 Tax=endosymbiont GvMRE of Glomus versiforme TaxID=2039283 RepID=UPI000EBFD77F|nr:hypothetical protein [endosymbiont GvMRE of Glomus versiforme]RHZ36514.1 hypothetical protein GvMRE_I2g503 [endosymbiont GvMRE of Glomus versiforme]
MKFSKICKNKLFYLISGVVLNILPCICCFFYYQTKLFASPSQFIFEFFTINWCVWNSIITVIYNLREIKAIKSNQQKGRGNFDLVVPASNLATIIIFTTSFLIMGNLETKSSLFWWTYILIWHYFAPIVALIYFLKFIKTKRIDFNDNTKKVFSPAFFIITSILAVFFLTNLLRRFSINPVYFESPYYFRKFFVWWFAYLEKGEIIQLLFWITISLFIFWLSLYLLLRVKKRYFPKTIYSVKKKKLFSLVNEEIN